MDRLLALKQEIAKLKSQAGTDKTLIAAKATELETLKSTLSEAEGGFTPIERAQYDKKMAKLARADKFLGGSSSQAKPKEAPIKKSPEDPEPEPQTFDSRNKKTCPKELERAYYPRVVEAVWDQWWFVGFPPVAVA